MAYRFGDFEVDVACHELRRNEQVVDLQRLPFALLVYLIENRDRVVSKQELLEQVWQRSHSSDSTLPTGVRALRSALGDPASNPTIVSTVRGRGYRFLPRLKPSRTMDTTSRSSPFIGRSGELAALNEAVSAAGAGRTQVVFVLGDAGIGKTRLVDQFAHECAALGIQLGHGGCEEGEGAPPYWPWIQLLRSLPGRADSVLAALSGHGEIRDLHGVTPHDRFLLFQSVAEEMRRMSDRATLLLAFDDLHRSDLASLQLLEFVLREARSSPIVAVGTYRDAELEGPRAHALGRISRCAESRFLRLDGLTSAETNEMAVAGAGGQVTEGLVSRFHEQSGGNPFFLTHLIAMLVKDRDHSAKLRLPSGLREAISEQLADLSAEHRAVLRGAAVFGREFSLPVLEKTLEATAGVAQAIDRALRSRVLVPGDTDGVVRFSHMLVRDVLYDEIPFEHRAALHWEAGLAIEGTNRSTPEHVAAGLAHHFAEAIPAAGPAKALHYSRYAGDHALERCAYDAAVEHYERALRIAEENQRDEQLLCQLLLLLGDAQGRAYHRRAGSETLLRAARMARRIGATVHLAEAALRFAPGFFAVEAGVEDAALVGLLREALSTLRDRNPRLRARLLGRLAMARYWMAPSAELQTLLSEAQSLAGRHGDAQTRVAVQQAHLVATWTADNTHERLGASLALIDAADRSGDSEPSLVARMLRICTLMEVGDVEEADLSIREFHRITHEGNEAYGIWYALLAQAMRLHVSGDFEAAQEKAYEFGVAGERVQGVNTELSWAAFKGLLAWQRGQLEGVLELATGLIRTYRSLPVIRAIRIRVLIDVGAPEVASAELTQLLSEGHLERKLDTQYLWSLCFLSESIACLGDREQAKAVYDSFERFGDRYVVGGYGVMCWGAAARHLGQLAWVLGRTDAAVTHFEQALAMNRRIRARPFIAFTAFELARVLSEQADSDKHRVRALLLEAQEAAEEMDLSQLREDCSRLVSQLDSESALDT